MSLTFLRNRLYYTVKPWVPEAARLALRRSYTRRQRAKCENTWPILPGSEVAPKGWPGWPNGKPFAVVLTHDVEGQVGVSRCLDLMRMEIGFGFRSSFNFIPEGNYRVSDELRSELRRSGFEVGVHDLHHDGKLYRNYRTFLKYAERINHYLREWQALGFRSGFMLHNLEWAHNLDILYEASTFDTDPFEPQPEGVGTIFPFWVPRPRSLPGAINEPSFGADSTCLDMTLGRGISSRGYVELPYTLVQDSTLFTLLGEHQLDFWFKKVDWLAQNGGMVLVNVHPDYTTMNGTAHSPWEYPVELYCRLLEYLRDRYGDAFWHVTAAELASWYKATLEKSGRVMAAAAEGDRAGCSSGPAGGIKCCAGNGEGVGPQQLNSIATGLSKP